MKAVKSLILFCFLLVGVSSCFDPPVFSDSPEISFNKIEFKVTPSPVEADTLILYIDFKDGNGNLGLSKTTLQHFSDPFHPHTFFLETPGDGVKAASTFQARISAPPPIPQEVAVLKSTGSLGKLLTKRTRSKPGYGYLPTFVPDEMDCKNYIYTYLLIPPELLDVIDSTYNVVATSPNTGAVIIRDTLYFDQNPNYYNIRIRFYQKVGTTLQEFSWEDEFCSTFSGRFPVLSDKNDPVEGTLRYNMKSSGFIPLFSVKTLTLDVIITDRTLKSDSIRTPEFTLDRIRVN